MTDWSEQFSAALDERDAREQAHKSYIDAYTKLADKTATTSAALTAAVLPTSPTPADTISTPTKGKGSAPTDPSEPLPTSLTALRLDLASTQKARSTLQTQVDDLSSTIASLQLQQKSSNSQIAQLTRQKADVERKLRDREEEIKGKQKLVVQAQDEMVALSLQLNMSEQKSERLDKDNRELTERWMVQKGREAERMNRDSRWS